MPKWYLDEPVASDATRICISAFNELSTERSIGMAVGPIPESRIREHGVRLRLDDGTMVLFRAVIRALDVAFQDHVEKRRKNAQGKSGNDQEKS